MSEEEIKTIVVNGIEIPVEYLSQTNVIIQGKRYIQLQKENQELKKQLEDVSKTCIADHKYASSKEDEVITLQQENQQLKEQNNNYRRLGFKHLQQQNNLYQSVIDEVQHILNNQIDYREFVDVVNAIEEVLDKANIKESK